MLLIHGGNFQCICLRCEQKCQTAASVSISSVPGVTIHSPESVIEILSYCAGSFNYSIPLCILSESLCTDRRVDKRVKCFYCYLIMPHILDCFIPVQMGIFFYDHSRCEKSPSQALCTSEVLAFIRGRKISFCHVKNTTGAKSVLVDKMGFDGAVIKKTGH